MSLKCIELFVAKFQQNLHNHFLICVPDLNIPKRLYKGKNQTFHVQNYSIFKINRKGWKPNLDDFPFCMHVDGALEEHDQLLILDVFFVFSEI